MKIISVIILIGFVSLAIFGFAGILATSDMSHAELSSCLASLAQNGACPPPEHSFASALFHTNAFKVFSTSVIAAFFAAVVLSLAGFVSSFAGGLISAVQNITSVISDVLVRYFALRRQRFAIARLEFSPTVI